MEELKKAFQFVSDVVSWANQIGEVPSGGTGKKMKPKKRQGYVIRTVETPLIKKALNAKRAELSLSLQIEPHLGEPIHFSLSASMHRGGKDDTGGKNREAGG